MANPQAHKWREVKRGACVCSCFSALYFLKCLQLWPPAWTPIGKGALEALVSSVTHLWVHSYMHPWEPISARCPLATDHPLQGLIVGGRKEKTEKQGTHVGRFCLPHQPSQPMASYLPVSVSRGGHNKTPQAHWFRQQKRISHHSGGWKSTTKVPAVCFLPGRLSLACKRLLPGPQVASICVHSSEVKMPQA